MTLTFYVEVALDVLLAATLGYCILLERRLAAVRRGQEGLSRIVGELNMAISGAGASLARPNPPPMKRRSTLDERLKRARLHIDELSVLVGFGRAHRRPHRTRRRHVPRARAAAPTSSLCPPPAS